MNVVPLGMPDPVELMSVHMRAFTDTIDPKVKLSSFMAAVSLFRKYKVDEYLPMMRAMSQELVQMMRGTRSDPALQSRTAMCLDKFTRILERLNETEGSGSQFHAYKRADDNSSARVPPRSAAEPRRNGYGTPRLLGYNGFSGVDAEP